MITVGISDMKLAKPPDTLVTYALGSCVGICLYDPVAKLGGMSHIMLPDSSIAPGTATAKFADTALPALVKMMEQNGGARSRITAKIAGGAQMFGNTSPSGKDLVWQIGQRNVSAVLAILHMLKIPIVGQDVLKNYGRTLFFDPASGEVKVKALRKGERVF